MRKALWGTISGMLSVMALVAVVPPAAGTEAAGTPPTRTETDLKRVVANPAACGDYGVEWSINLHSVNWTFFDEQGRRVKLVQHITEDNTVRNTVTGLTLADSPVDFIQTSTFDPETARRQHIFIVGTSVNVRRATSTSLIAGRS